VLDSSISHQQAISILQKARGRVELVVARGSELQPGQDSVLPSDWCQVEVRRIVLEHVEDQNYNLVKILFYHQTGVKWR
jgi:hypothetical protein